MTIQGFARLQNQFALAPDLHVPRSSRAKSPNRFRGRERGGIARNMELELEELFPKKSDLRLQAVRLLMHLEESGPKKQTELVEELDMEDYAMSRLLAKLELHRYITRRREGTDKIVSLRNER